MKLVLIPALAAGIIGGWLGAGVAQADPPQPKICASHEENAVVPSDHKQGNKYIPGCAVGTGGPGPSQTVVRDEFGNIVVKCLRNCPKATPAPVPPVGTTDGGAVQ